jgi:hypothetical protein
MAEPRRAGSAEALAVWALYGLFTIAVLITYARVPHRELYHVSGSGLEGGAGRALVFLNYPTALAAIAALAVVRQRLPGRGAGWAVLTALVLCAVVGVPGVVDQSDLDAKPANAAPALGVAIALGLAVTVVVRRGVSAAPRDGWDPLRGGLALVLLLAAIPWLAAELGFYADDVPGLRAVFRSEELYEGHASVHLGDHHGMDGVLLVLTALALTRPLGLMARTGLRTLLAFYLALMLVYGFALALEDFWLEQLVKRGATGHRLPNMIRPELNPAWGALLAAAALVAWAFVGLGRVEPEPPRG